MKKRLRNPPGLKCACSIAALCLVIQPLPGPANGQTVPLQAQVVKGFNHFNELIKKQGLQGVANAIQQCYRDQSYTPDSNTVIPCLALDQTAVIVVPIMSAHFGQQTPLFFQQSLFQNRYHPTLCRVGFPDFTVENNIMVDMALQVHQLLADMAHHLPPEQNAMP